MSKVGCSMYIIPYLEQLGRLGQLCHTLRYLPRDVRQVTFSLGIVNKLLDEKGRHF